MYIVIGDEWGVTTVDVYTGDATASGPASRPSDAAGSAVIDVYIGDATARGTTFDDASPELINLLEQMNDGQDEGVPLDEFLRSIEGRRRPLRIQGPPRQTPPNRGERIRQTLRARRR